MVRPIATGTAVFERNGDGAFNDFLGLNRTGSIEVSAQEIARYVYAFIRKGLLVHVVNVSDLRLVVPRSVVEDQLDDIAPHPEFDNLVCTHHPLTLGLFVDWIEWGNRFWDVLYYFAAASPEMVPLAITTEEEADSLLEVFYHGDQLDEGDEEQGSEMITCRVAVESTFSGSNLGEPSDKRLGNTMRRLLWQYMWLMLRGSLTTGTTVDSNTGAITQTQPIPQFLSNTLGMSEPIEQVNRRLASFPVSLIDNRWIKHIPLEGAAAEIVNRIGLGVAGYRLLKPFAVYQDLPRRRYDEATRLATAEAAYPGAGAAHINEVAVFSESEADYTRRHNAFIVAQAIARTPLDWNIHSATRASWVQELLGGLNAPLENLMLLSFGPGTIASFTAAGSKMLFRAPVYHPGADTFGAWTLGCLNFLDDPILPHGRTVPAPMLPGANPGPSSGGNGPDSDDGRGDGGNDGNQRRNRRADQKLQGINPGGSGTWTQPPPKLIPPPSASGTESTQAQGLTTQAAATSGAAGPAAASATATAEGKPGIVVYSKPRAPSKLTKQEKQRLAKQKGKQKATAPEPTRQQPRIDTSMPSSSGAGIQAVLGTPDTIYRKKADVQMPPQDSRDDLEITPTEAMSKLNLTDEKL